jgi:hypothetical protein
VIEKKRVNYVIVDTTVEGNKGREVEKNLSRKSALQKCRDFNRYIADHEEGMK